MSHDPQVHGQKTTARVATARTFQGQTRMLKKTGDSIDASPMAHNLRQTTHTVIAARLEYGLFICVIFPTG